MAYIGREPQIGNFQVCDAISVVNGQAAYTMQVGGANVSPETANHMIVSLNGIIQAPGTSYTVSGSTITFASNLATGDVINFIHILGSVLDLGVPSDGTVTAAKVANDLISGKTALTVSPATTDEILISDGGTLKKIDYSVFGNTPCFYGEKASDLDLSRGVTTQVTGFTTEEIDTHSAFDGTTFTVPSNEGGKYFLQCALQFDFSDEGNDGENAIAFLYKGSSEVKRSTHGTNASTDRNLARRVVTVSAILDLAASDTIKFYAYGVDANGGGGGTVEDVDSHVFGYKLIGV